MDSFAAVERALRGAAPHELPDVVRATLVKHYAATAVSLLMADYGATTLRPVDVLPSAAEPMFVHASTPGRAFGAQRPQVSSGGTPPVVTAHLPVTVRGDRLGILSVTLPGARYSPEVLSELGDISEILGREIVVAARDTDLYLRARRADRLTLAAEMHWQLLPGQACSRPEFDLGAQLEPAYAVFGDTFDWSTSADHLTLTVANGTGEGIEAALLTSLAVNALRNARRAGLGLVDQACLADQAVYGQHRGAAHLSVLLLRFELATGRIEVVDAGSPRVWRLRDGALEPLEFEAQLPLGMFEDTIYQAQYARVLPGDRLLCVSEGVCDATSPAGERYSERALARAVTSTRLLPASQVPRALLQELAGHCARPPRPEDDALVLCLDWHGRP
ncbi:PP2C family protein-serine/threonine phosphatase [Streptomyces sp. bgisy100]|uniref:PP2C family protein-serine/threonine phosphatase n=1 Tax=Streptomyces sp. bgisy100 TaxID=3413783 RepID=UPI003D70E732